MNQISFCIPGIPPTVNHQGGFGRGRVWKTAKAKEYAEKVRVYAMKAMNDSGYNGFHGPCSVDIAYYFPDKRRRDCGNHDKVLLDALNGAVYADDSQIGDNGNPHNAPLGGWRLSTSKYLDRENARTEVKIIWSE